MELCDKENRIYYFLNFAFEKNEKIYYVKHTSHIL